MLKPTTGCSLLAFKLGATIIDEIHYLQIVGGTDEHNPLLVGGVEVHMRQLNTHIHNSSDVHRTYSKVGCLCLFSLNFWIGVFELLDRSVIVYSGENLTFLFKGNMKLGRV